ncbi:MAG: phosphotransferase [Deltaproteobacteria bacterium]|nr:phosphotransferase [Deltaproteobacteria bacterium]
MVDPGLETLVGEKLRAAFGPTARLVALSPLAGDASSRRYYRARLNGETVPATVIVMELCGSSLPLSSEELAIFNEPLRELPFINLHRFLSGLGVRIPRLYGHWVEDGVLFLEDLGDLSLWERVQGLSPAEVLNWYERAIDQMLLIHIAGSKKRGEDCIAFKQRFDFRLYMWEFEHFIEYGLEKKPGGKISAAEKEFLIDRFATISRRLEAEPPCLNHRDYHSWNLMVRGEEVVVIDFQDALLAPPQYDLASLLNDRETDRIIRPDLEERLCGYYLKKRVEMGAPEVGRDQFLEIYILSALQRDLKVVGRFYYLDVVKGKPGYRKYIPPTLRRIKRNLSKVAPYDQLIPVLAPHFEEMR